MNRPFYVVSPDFEKYHFNGIDPPEYGCDVFEVEARTRREAIVVGVRLALKERHSWAVGNVESEQPPWAGYRAELAVCGHGNPHFQIVNGKAAYLRCWACDEQADRAIAADEATA